MWTVVLGFLGKLKPVLTNKYVLVALVAVAMLGGGYLFGRYSTPNKIVEKEKIIEKIVYQEKVVEKIVYVQKQKEKRKTDTTIIKKPDGTTETRVVENVDTDTDTNINTDRTKEIIVYKDRIVEKEKLVLKGGSDWRVGIGVGVNALYYTGREADYLTQQLKGVSLQLEIDRRIVGPMWMGLFVNSHSDVGLNLSFQF